MKGLIDRHEAALLGAIYLARPCTYHHPWKNASFRFVILRGHLWGGRFQMSVIGERQVTGGMAEILQVKKDIYPLNMEGF
jgi:hypothetical protein